MTTQESTIGTFLTKSESLAIKGIDTGQSTEDYLLFVTTLSSVCGLISL